MSLKTDCETSENREKEIYFQVSRQLYEDAVARCAELYEIARHLTNDFSKITSEAIINDSRIIKILRYITIPSLSQMKLGQFTDLDSTASYELHKIDKGSKHKKLIEIAPQIVSLVENHLDSRRFLWLEKNLTGENLQLAHQYAKHWTCSLAGDQNAGTAFRNWRKTRQENGIENAISNAGYVEVPKPKIIENISDLLPGQYTSECRVKGTTVQKADFAIRLRNSHRLFLIEAKAVGVKIDAFKRIKECREKAADWTAAFGNQCTFGAVIAGFIPMSQASSLLANGNLLFWEHRLEDLEKFLNEGK